VEDVMGTVRRVREGIDFGDEDAVLAEIARELDIDPDELDIKEETGLTGFGTGTVYEITIKGGHKEWMVVENSDQEEELAVEIVKQDLEEEPELFGKSFIESHINMDRLAARPDGRCAQQQHRDPSGPKRRRVLARVRARWFRRARRGRGR
jgi:hypothetical protein